MWSIINDESDLPPTQWLEYPKFTPDYNERMYLVWTNGAPQVLQWREAEPWAETLLFHPLPIYPPDRCGHNGGG